MIKGNPRFGYELTCDICGEDFDFETFDDAVDYKKENGWISEKYKGEWQDICPECQEGNMERLTEVSWKNLDPWETCGQGMYCTRNCHEDGGCANGCPVPKNYRRLAEYEDLGMTPEEIASLKEQLDIFRSEVQGSPKRLAELQFQVETLTETVNILSPLMAKNSELKEECGYWEREARKLGREILERNLYEWSKK